MIPRIHKEGWPTLINVGLLLGIINFTASYYLENALLKAFLAGFSLVLGVFFLQFFRHPKRRAPGPPFGVLSPADGKVVFVGKVNEPEVLQAEAVQLSIFMSPFNVHVNRYPVTGEVLYVKHHPGRYLVAWHPKSSELNERCTTAILQEDGQVVVVRQIAGILARRIVNYARVGQRVQAGEEMGFIKFGSRADVFWIPRDDWEIAVKEGDAVKAKESVLARLKSR